MTNINIPTVTQDDINTFHSKHFSPAVIDSFFRNFQHAQQHAYNAHHQPQNTHIEVDAHEEEEQEEEEDGLGYYPDGVKRTLTDEQIAIFRHSEEETLRRVERKKLEEAKKLEESFLARFHGGNNDDNNSAEDDGGDGMEGNVNKEGMEDIVTEEEEKKTESIGRVDPASGKTFMWPAISSGN